MVCLREELLKKTISLCIKTFDRGEAGAGSDGVCHSLFVGGHNSLAGYRFSLAVIGVLRSNESAPSDGCARHAKHTVPAYFMPGTPPGRRSGGSCAGCVASCASTTPMAWCKCRGMWFNCPRSLRGRDGCSFSADPSRCRLRRLCLCAPFA